MRGELAAQAGRMEAVWPVQRQPRIQPPGFAPGVAGRHQHPPTARAAAAYDPLTAGKSPRRACEGQTM